MTEHHRPARRARAVLWTLLATCCISAQAQASPPVPLPLSAERDVSVGHTHTQPVPRLADFGRTEASKEVRHVAHWVVHSGDNVGKPFVIVDKQGARVFVFDARGTLTAASSALLGLAIGDDSAPGVGDKKIADIRPHERTTPAGRFVANLDKNAKGQAMLWVDYDTAISMHPVVAGHPRERRAQRLASSAPAERRISYGCINIPAHFFDQVVSPAFNGTDGIVYVLPEVQSVRAVFGSYDAVGRTGGQSEAR